MTNEEDGHRRGAEDVPWWREHVAYAVEVRRDMRRDHAVAVALTVLAIAGGTVAAAVTSWWVLVPVATVAIILLGLVGREWRKSEVTIARSLRRRRAGLADAERATRRLANPGFEVR